ncbi:MAG: DUF3822 family protein [Flavobacteriales bacterium]|nr:DUF3822 family protein [Flavobacteriales bacterium]
MKTGNCSLRTLIEMMMEVQVHPDAVKESERFAMLHAAHCHIAICFLEEKIQAGVFDLDRGCVIWLKEYTRSQDQNRVEFANHVFYSNKILTGMFRKATIAISGAAFSPVPSAFFHAGKEASHLQINAGSTNGKIFTQVLKNADVTMVYSQDHEISSVIETHFPAAKTISHVATFAEYAMAVNHDRKNVLLAQVDANQMMLVAVATGLMMCNQFEVAQPDDALYHIANTAARLGMELQTTRILLAGDHSFLKNLQISLMHYSPHSTFCGFDELKCNEDITALPRYHFAPVITQFLCA